MTPTGSKTRRLRFSVERFPINNINNALISPSDKRGKFKREASGLEEDGGSLQGGEKLLETRNYSGESRYVSTEEERPPAEKLHPTEMSYG